MRALGFCVLSAVLCLLLAEVHCDCNGRKVLTAKTGTISDGPGNYTPVAHCEWLIDGHGNSSILLTFNTMNTECSYDFLFVYDGDSYEKPLLASLSGDQLPKPLLATSGYMLVYLYSDRNYELAGFDAKYEIMDCPYNCTGRGTCTNGWCDCLSIYHGVGCEKEKCPNGCNADANQGECDPSGRCKCRNGFVGENCSMSRNDGRGNNTWYLLASETAGFQGRTSHAGVFIESFESIWIFGGYTLNEVLDELIVFNMSSNHWETVEKSTPWPAGRYLHAMVAVKGGFAMYGGQLDTSELSDELWYFDIPKMSWNLVRPSPEAHRLPKLASHSLTLGKEWIYLFGGKTEDGFFSGDMFRIRAQNLSDSQRIFIKGGQIASRQLAGHSTVYHKQTNTLLVFGGHRTNTAQFSKLRNDLHIFHIDNSFWSLVSEDQKEKNLPSQRAYHSAVIIGDYMVIYGGNTQLHDGYDLCYDAAIYFYHLGCYKWMNSQHFVKKFPGLSSSTKPSRRFGHVAMVAYGNTLLISGGYSGYVLGDLLAFKVAPAIAVHKSISLDVYDHCNVYSRETCTSDPACSVCLRPASLTCVNRAGQNNCTQRGNDALCKGFCRKLQSCDSCLNLGGHYPTVVTDNSWYYQSFQYCAWCVKEAKCQPANALSDTCAKQSSHNTASGNLGWWNGPSVHLIELRQCLTEDRPAGLHFLRYRSPPNETYPDELEIIKKTKQELVFRSWIEKENQEDAPYTGKFVGYIYPLNISKGYAINISMSTSQSRATFYLSKDDNPRNKEIVAEQPYRGTSSTLNAARPDHSPLFPNVGRGYRYYMELNATQLITGKDKQPSAELTLQRNSSNQNSQWEPWTEEFLEPFHGGNCSQYYNCLACMADTACGWCTEDNSCHHREASQRTGQPTCGQEVERHLVLAWADCPMCIDHVDCQSCVSDNLCEWVPDYLFCIRRGRFADSIRNTSACHLPCKSHTSCETCLGVQNECAWCENLQTCFTFSEYTTRFMYGHCLKWLDWEAKTGTLQLQCHSCQSHKTCKECMQNFGCGWCSNDENPAIGMCIQGDFAGPTSGESCSAVMASHVNETQNASWAYSVCPDVQECELGLDDCHENASCINTLDGYNCTCHRGFVGNGRDTCDKTCYHICDKGNCSGPPDYVCNCSLGWTGDSCNISCGCNNHSTCKKNGVGTCDACQQNTAGEHCEICQPGSYGDPQLPAGCLLCECNGHGNELLGTCHNTTGKCFCQDDTDGNQCEYCQHGFYGDPRKGQKCYMGCNDRKILTDILTGSLGSYHQRWTPTLSGPRAYCLWILTVFSDVDSPSTNQVIPSITLEIEPKIDVRCLEDYVFVYDGLPHFASGKKPTSSRLLGAFCGQGHKELMAVTARSGILTVFYQSDVSHGVTSHGFNASYHVNGCPENCDHGNRECINNKCVCMAGFKGDNCEEEICPKNCSVSLNQGYCDQGCVCKPGYVGPSCEIKLIPNGVSIEPVTTYDDPNADPDIGRMGHTMSKCGEDSLYIFGGYSLRHGMLADLYHLNTTSGKWTLIEPQSESVPKARYFHAAVCLPNMQALYVYGGLVEQEGAEPPTFEASQEMWKFNLESRLWAVEEGPKWVHTLAGHTMTQISDTKLMLIGGFSIQNYFSNKVYEYNTGGGLMAWKEYTDRNEMDGATPVGLFGHAAVFHEPSNTVYVFGGYLYKSDSFGPSREMYAFDLDNSEWTVLQPENGEQPIPRFFHNMVGRENDLVVIGGMTENGEMTASIQVYRYTCNAWVTVSNTDYVHIVGKLQPAIGSTAVAMNDSLYIFGGYNGVSMGSLIKLTLPNDICLVLRDSSMCRRTVGCSGCIVPTPTGNLSYCYSSGLRAPESCDSSNATLRQGALCTESWLNIRDCEQFTNCSQCLAVYPQFKHAKMACMWCTNCEVGRCVSIKDRCDEKQCRGVEQTPIHLAKGCVEARCQAADCDKCSDLEPKCLWTTRSKRTSEVIRSLTLHARYSGNCVENTINLNHLMSSKQKCPRRCFSFTTCHTCLDTESAEGGAKTCVWSDKLQQCLPYAAVPLVCSGGQCGYLINDPLEKSGRCPVECAFHTRCSTCLKAPGCGWCAFGGKNGSGVCMAGGLHHPSVGVCTAGHVQLATPNQEVAAANRSLQFLDPIFWSFMECPPENECENNHHNCNNETEDCQDTPRAYRCVCKQGYEKARGQLECVPQCNQGCIRGRCVRPDDCACDFGWVGRNCSVECQCNKHSNCKSENETTVCTGCSNNTMGHQCSLCKPFFVGDPKDGKPCIPCRQFCNNHTDFCVTYEESIGYGLDYASQSISKNQLSKIRTGPKEEDAVCLSCQHNTTKKRCDKCLMGYFRIRQDDKLIQPCLKCQCNGHSATCDELTGENCDCHNNTETSCNKDSKEKKPCWQKQCSSCKEYFLGHPINGHQCYRHMTMEQDYCFNPVTQNRCNQETLPLHQGRTVFFSVQPKYLNVNIRITVDVTEGAADVYFSPCEDTFLVDVDPLGFHTVLIDPNYQLIQSQNTVFQGQRRNVVNCSHDKSNYRKLEMDANELNTFVTVDYAKTLLLVKNVTFRLVITLPLDVHNLRSSRFYVILRSRGIRTSNKTFGSLYFRQDQPHIDLFVFFSVFFSCFFLFLAKCVLLWKVKQTFDARRTRQQRAREMKHMASRPFARVLVYIEQEPVTGLQPAFTRRNNRLPKIRTNHADPPNTGSNPTSGRESPFNLAPIAVEPTDDGIAAVGTVILRLPGGNSAPSKLSLGSALTTRLHTGPAGAHSQKVNIRRRYSASFA